MPIADSLFAEKTLVEAINNADNEITFLYLFTLFEPYIPILEEGFNLVDLSSKRYQRYLNQGFEGMSSKKLNVTAVVTLNLHKSKRCPAVVRTKKTAPGFASSQ